MAFTGGEKSRDVLSDGRIQMTVEEFKKWLMSFDADHDGRISQKELRAALRSRGMWFTMWKSSRGMKEADVDGTGYIDQNEIDYLLDFAEKSMGFKFC